jgi:hypothetical protein
MFPDWFPHHLNHPKFSRRGFPNPDDRSPLGKKQLFSVLGKQKPVFFLNSAANGFPFELPWLREGN